jgi:hypothetical protein
MAVSFDLDNSKNPNAPEFGKPWKKEHHGSCFCSTCEPPPLRCVTTISRSTRFVVDISSLEPCPTTCEDACVKTECEVPKVIG